MPICMVQEDLGGFGDERLRRVGARLLEAMSEQPTTCVHALATDRNEALAFGRFLDHEAVSCDEMLTTAARFTGQRAVGRHVLAIQDTTEFNFPNHAASKRGFGRSGNDRDVGLFLHPTIAVDAASGGMIGLVGAQILNRTGAKVKNPKPRPIEDKESFRWLLAAEEASDVLAGAASITVVADRESDIYEQFARRPESVHLLTRAARDRNLAEAERLFETIDAWPERHRATINLPELPGRRARTACLALRFGAVSLCRPVTVDKKLAACVELFVVDVVEVDPPAGVEPLHWRLLTTHAVTTVEQAQQIVTWYRLRWTIEQVFRTLKSAAVQMDQSQITEARRFVKLAIVGLICAVQDHADRDWSRRADCAKHGRRHRSGTRARLGRAQRSSRRQDRETEKPIPASDLGLVCLDRRPPRRLVRLHLPRLQAGRSEDHRQRTCPSGRLPPRMGVGNLFRRCATPVAYWGIHRDGATTRPCPRAVQCAGFTHARRSAYPRRRLNGRV